MDVCERKMRGLLLDPTGHIRRPQLGENFQARHVEIPVMKEGCQLGHVLRQESPVLTDAVAAHRRRALIDVLAQELQRCLFGFGFSNLALTHPLGQS